MSATPRPWAATYQNYRNGYHNFKIEGLNLVNIGGFQSCRQMADAQSDADLIVRAINSHDTLIAALETLLYVDKQSGIGIYDDRATAHRMARDALARAKGDQS